MKKTKQNKIDTIPTEANPADISFDVNVVVVVVVIIKV